MGSCHECVVTCAITQDRTVNCDETLLAVLKYTMRQRTMVLNSTSLKPFAACVQSLTLLYWKLLQGLGPLMQGMYNFACMQVNSCLGFSYAKCTKWGYNSPYLIVGWIAHSNGTGAELCNILPSKILGGILFDKRKRYYNCSLHFLCLETANDSITKMEASCDTNWATSSFSFVSMISWSSYSSCAAEDTVHEWDSWICSHSK